MKRGSHSSFPIISRHPFIVSAWLHVSQEETVEGLALVRGVRSIHGGCLPPWATTCIVESNAWERHLGVFCAQKQIKVFKYLPDWKS